MSFRRELGLGRTDIAGFKHIKSEVRHPPFWIIRSQKLRRLYDKVMRTP